MDRGEDSVVVSCKCIHDDDEILYIIYYFILVVGVRANFRKNCFYVFYVFTVLYILIAKPGMR